MGCRSSLLGAHCAIFIKSLSSSTVRVVTAQKAREGDSSQQGGKSWLNNVGHTKPFIVCAGLLLSAGGSEHGQAITRLLRSLPNPCCHNRMAVGTFKCDGLLECSCEGKGNVEWWMHKLLTAFELLACLAEEGRGYAAK